MFKRKRLLFNLYKYKRKLIEPLIQHTRNYTPKNAPIPKILFFGTDNFSLPSLKALNGANIELGVVTSFKNPANCIRQYAEKQQLPLYRWPDNFDVKNKNRQLSELSIGCRNYQLGVVVSFGHLIPTNIIQALPLGMINVHASLLPRWRGAAPIIYAIIYGDKATGVSIMKIEPKHFDIGDILAQARVPIKANCFMPELHATLANKGAELLLDVVKNFKSKLAHAEKQDELLVTYAPKVTSALTEVNWSTLSAQEIFRRYRALFGFKNLTTKFQDKQVQLIEIKVADPAAVNENLVTPSSFMYSRERKSLLVCCAADSFLEILKLRVEGRKIMSAQDFNNGFLKKLKNADISVVGNKSLAAFN